MGVVAVYRPGSPSFVEWHDRHPGIPNGCLSVPACRYHGTQQPCFAWGAELQPRIRSPAPRLAKDPRFGFGRWRRSSNDDGACVHHRWLDGYLVLSVSRMGAACKCEISADQSLVAGAVLCALEY